jgi:hypothetical protein
MISIHKSLLLLWANDANRRETQEYNCGILPATTRPRDVK